MAEIREHSCRPWCWVPTLYLAEGMPYALVVVVASVVYKNLGVSNSDITFYTGFLYLPWVCKPFWGPVVEGWKTRRQWIWAGQLVLAAGLAGVAASLGGTHFFMASLAFFWVLAFASATHDMAADGFYIQALAEPEQALYSGVRNTFYRLANIGVQGGLVMLAGKLAVESGNYAAAWRGAYLLAAFILLSAAVYHWKILPYAREDVAATGHSAGGNFQEVFLTFFKKPGIATMIAFLLLYRLGEAQLLSVARLFLLEDRSRGGLGLTDVQYGWIYGTFGVGALLVGGLLGGFAVSRKGLKACLWPMLLAIHVPDMVFIWLAYAQPGNAYVIGMGVVLELIVSCFPFQ